MLLYIVRHGETEHNKEEVFRGRKDMPLNETGETQSKQLGAYFQDKYINRIFASPLIRAQQTAHAISEAVNAPVETVKEFTDMNLGIWEGLALREVERLYPHEFSLWKKTPHKLNLKGGESLARVRKRAGRGMEKVFSGEGDCVIVTHRVLCKIMILQAMDVPNSHFWSIKFDAASISLVERKDGEMTVHFINDTCHLRDGHR